MTPTLSVWRPEAEAVQIRNFSAWRPEAEAVQIRNLSSATSICCENATSRLGASGGRADLQLVVRGLHPLRNRNFSARQAEKLAGELRLKEAGGTQRKTI